MWHAGHVSESSGHGSSDAGQCPSGGIGGWTGPSLARAGGLRAMAGAAGDGALQAVMRMSTTARFRIDTAHPTTRPRTPPVSSRGVPHAEQVSWRRRRARCAPETGALLPNEIARLDGALATLSTASATTHRQSTLCHRARSLASGGQLRLHRLTAHGASAPVELADGLHGSPYLGERLSRHHERHGD
jgi:hypothetical protein